MYRESPVLCRFREMSALWPYRTVWPAVISTIQDTDEIASLTFLSSLEFGGDVKSSLGIHRIAGYLVLFRILTIKLAHVITQGGWPG